jgi:hypothetical protein
MADVGDKERDVMFRPGAAILAAVLLAACTAGDATPSAGPSSGNVSLQTPPYAGEATPGGPAAPLAAPPTQAPEAMLPDASQDISLASIASQFDPARQRFVWVLPPGIHGEGPWDFSAVVKIRGEPKFETTLPLKAELAPAGSRPEYTAGYEIVRLTDDGRWAQSTAEVDKVIQELVAEYGRGLGELEMISQLHVSVEPAYRAQHCAAGARHDVRAYVEEDGKPLISLNDASMSAMITQVIREACP